MKNVSDAVLTVLQQDEYGYEALRRGFLNLSSYAELIHDQVEALTQKKVQRGTIVVSLSRISKTVASHEPIKPEIYLDDITLRSPLCDVSYAKTTENIKAIQNFQINFDNNEKEFLMVTQSVREITVILPSDAKQTLFSQVDGEPKEYFDDLVGVTLSFSSTYLSMPNVVYSIISQLAIQRINIREIVSTYTELSIIIDKKDMNLAIESLQVFFERGKEIKHSV